MSITHILARRVIFPKTTLLIAVLATTTPAFAGSFGDSARGAALYGDQCSACHAPDEDRSGPHHRGVIGRRAGSVAGFDYSDALAQAGFTWTDATLDAWLADPQALVPGQRMDVAIEDAQDRADLIAYLKTLQP